MGCQNLKKRYLILSIPISSIFLDVNLYLAFVVFLSLISYRLFPLIKTIISPMKSVRDATYNMRVSHFVIQLHSKYICIKTIPPPIFLLLNFHIHTYRVQWVNCCDLIFLALCTVESSGHYL